MEKNWDNINAILKYSFANKDAMKQEYDKLCEYYNNNQSQLIKDLLDLKGSIQDEDYYTNIINDRASNMLEDILNSDEYKNMISFNENYLLDSLYKIYQQVKLIPNESINENEEVKIFFYNMSEKITNNSRLIVSLFRMNLRSFYELYYTTNN